MRVFVTGGSGFVGSAVVAELIGAGHSVLGLARSDANAEALATPARKSTAARSRTSTASSSGAEAADGVIHCAFIHDFSKFVENSAIDKRAIEVLGEALAGSGRPLIVTSGVGAPAAGRSLDRGDDAAARTRHVPRVRRRRRWRSRRAACARWRSASRRACMARAIMASCRSSSRSRARRDARPMSAKGSTAGRPSIASTPRASIGSRWRRAPPGAQYHAVAEEGVPFRDIAAVIGKRLGVAGRQPRRPKRRRSISAGSRCSPRWTRPRRAR